MRSCCWNRVRRVFQCVSRRAQRGRCMQSCRDRWGVPTAMWRRRRWRSMLDRLSGPLRLLAQCRRGTARRCLMPRPIHPCMRGRLSPALPAVCSTMLRRRLTPRTFGDRRRRTVAPLRGASHRGVQPSALRCRDQRCLLVRARRASIRLRHRRCRRRTRAICRQGPR